MHKDNYNQKTATPSKESDANALIQQLLSATSPLTLLTGGHNLADILNVPDAHKVEKKRGRRSNAERLRSASLLDSLRSYPESGANAHSRHKLSLHDDRVPAEASRKNSGHETDAFVRMPVRKAKNEIIRRPEALENQQLLALASADFESDSEAPALMEVEYAPERENVCFASRATLGPLKRVKGAEGNMLDLLDFVQRRDDRTRLNKVYACKYCPKVYAKRAALGGHTAKNHPHLSDSYKVRQLSMNSRKIERERFDFFKHL